MNSDNAKKFGKIFQFDLVRKRQNLVNVFKECPLMSVFDSTFYRQNCVFVFYYSFIQIQQLIPPFYLYEMVFQKRSFYLYFMAFKVEI